jgi:hypothetical protein
VLEGWIRPKAEPFQRLADEASNACDELLQIVSPKAAVSAWHAAKPSTLSALHDIGVMDRFRWVLGAKASGASADLRYISEYFAQAGRWWAATYLADIFRELDKTAPEATLSIAAMPGREFVARTTSTVIRFHWASKMIASEIALQIMADQNFAERLPDFTVVNVERIVAASLGYQYAKAPITPADVKGMRLAAHMSTKAGKLANLPFRLAALSRDMEQKPWVSFEEGLSPCALTQVLFGLERSMFAAVDDQLMAADPKPGFGATKGELYERVAQQCLRWGLGTGRRDIKRPYKIKLTSGQRPDDVDCAVVRTMVEVIAEVKAMEIPGPHTTVANSFNDQISHVYRQLSRRLAALDAGTPLVDANNKQYRGANNLIGLGVVLHPYSNSLGDSRALAFLEHPADTQRIAIADLHSWLLILPAMRGLNEVRSYLRYRHQLHEVGALSADECDTALLFFSPAREHELARCRDAYQHRSNDCEFTVVGMLPASVSTTVGMQTAKPRDREKWRRQLLRDCHPTV